MFSILSAQPLLKFRSLFFEMLHLLFGVLTLTVLSKIAIPLWFTPIPLTFQTAGVLTIAAFLGSKKGSLTVLLYIVAGSLGLPIFSSGGHLLGPTGGYLISFVLAAYFVGFFLERSRAKMSHLVPLLLLVNLFILGFGALWLSFFVGLSNALYLGVYPFIAGEIFKVFIISPLIQKRSPLLVSIK